ncbi:TetR family transcriptional regulator [Rhodococcus rhodochrous]|uniref:TetR family transcriptional regulator n=1 Tax=Rhodococcus rhodochrous TaxID=1829 RepID=UPI000E74CDF2
MNERSLLDPPVNPTPRSNDEAILQAALKWFSELGFHGSSMRMIAEETGTSLSNLYNYYRSKSDILVAVLLRANESQHQQVAASVAAAENTPTARLHAAVSSYVEFILSHPTEALVALSELRYLKEKDRDKVVRGRDATQSLFEDLVRDGVQSGDFSTPYPEGAVRSILLMCSGVSIWYRPDGSLSPEEITDQHARYALALLEAQQLEPQS